MKKKILWSFIVSAGLALGACGTVDDPGQDEGNDENGDNDDNDSASGDDNDDNDSATDDGNTDGPGTDDGDSGSDTSPATTTVGFIEDPDGGGVDFECDLFAQDCEAGFKCMPWANDGGGAWNATRCTMIDDNPGQPGDTCTVEGDGTSGIDTCDIAVMCWDVDPKTNEGVCVGMCTGDESNPMCEDPQTTCAIANDGAIILCLPVCDPLLQDCSEGQGCYPINGEFTCAPDASGEMGNTFDPCEFINTCGPGNTCQDPMLNTACDAAAGGCCVPYCDTTNAMADCMGLGDACTPFFAEGEAPPGYEDVGVCTTGV